MFHSLKKLRNNLEGKMYAVIKGNYLYEWTCKKCNKPVTKTERILLCCGSMVEKKDRNTTLHLLHEIFTCNR